MASAEDFVNTVNTLKTIVDTIAPMAGKEETTNRNEKQETTTRNDVLKRLFPSLTGGRKRSAPPAEFIVFIYIP